ncbi:hypothetical protein ACIP79_00840 [Streptomyces sp. NPDC088747]|uniref:hypothetical protein n=1 Tax=Streptomyces sp. NPDC088747 TaxID=3365886 RepID=UPI0038291C3C
MATAVHRPLTQATSLITFAEEHGWTVLEQWTPPKFKGAPVLRVLIGRRVSKTESYLFRLEFRTDGSKSHRGGWQARTPRIPAWHKAPPAAAIRNIIAANPVRKAGES